MGSFELLVVIAAESCPGRRIKPEAGWGLFSARLWLVRSRDWQALGVQPRKRLLPVEKPLGREDCRPFDVFFSGVRETCRHHEGEPANAGSAVPGNNVGITPLHHPGSKLMPKLQRVDKEPAWPGLFCLPDEQAEGRHEATVAHGRGRGKPPQLQYVVIHPEYDSPGILREFGCHKCSLRDHLRSAAIGLREPANVLARKAKHAPMQRQEGTNW